MSDNSNILKTKIENFNSKFLAKDSIIVFEENSFDKALGILFLILKNISLPSIMFLKKMIMRLFDKFINFAKQQNSLQKKILKQEEILMNNVKLNSILSEQIKQLNSKIDQISLKNYDLFNSNIDTNNNQNNLIQREKTSELNIDEIAFYQKENLRISNELFETQKKFEIIKGEIERHEHQRSSLIEKINSVNEVIKDDNILTNVFDNNHNKNKIKIVDSNKKEDTTNYKNIDIEVEKIFNNKK